MNDQDNKKQRVVVLAGARSIEHEVSLVSAYNIVKAIDLNKYEVFVVGIDKKGIWRQYSSENFVEKTSGVGDITLSSSPISGRLSVTQSSPHFYDVDNGGKIACTADIIFPAILGNYAEDGTVQGMIRMMDVPFTTPDVIGSSVGMDKDVSYRLFREAGISVAPFITLRQNHAMPDYNATKKELGSEIIFVKPSNAGSSVGVSRVTTQDEFETALELAFKYDVKVIIQAAVEGRELEIGVIGNIGSMRTSLVGEIREKAADDFYSYDNKYINSSNVDLIAPADISDNLLNRLSEVAIKVCEVLECEGFGRVDFFVDENENIFVNEINTMPGFTAISMFPRLWGESGLSYPDLVDTLLQNAIKRHDYRVKPIVTDAEDVIVAAKQTSGK